MKSQSERAFQTGTFLAVTALLVGVTACETTAYLDGFAHHESVTESVQYDFNRNSTICKAIRLTNDGFGIYRVKDIRSRLEPWDEYYPDSSFGYVDLELVEKLTDDAPGTTTLRIFGGEDGYWQISARIDQVLIPFLYKTERNGGYPLSYAQTIFYQKEDRYVPGKPLYVSDEGLTKEELTQLVIAVRRDGLEDEDCPVRSPLLQEDELVLPDPSSIDADAGERR